MTSLQRRQNRHKALDAGFNVQQLVQKLRVLGIDFTKDGSTPCGDERLSKAIGRAARVAAASVP